MSKQLDRLSPKAPSECPADELIEKIPGVEAAINGRCDGVARGLLGGALGGVGGLVGGAKGDALTAQLTSLRLSLSTGFGEEKLRSMTDSIAGLSQFLWPKS